MNSQASNCPLIARYTPRYFSYLLARALAVGALGLCAPQASAVTVYNIIPLGLSGGVHSSFGASYNWALNLNNAGQVAGGAERYTAAGDWNGSSAWVYSGGTTQMVGLTNGVHIRSDGYQNNGISFFNAAGQAVGYAERYSGSMYNGESAWFYNGSTTQRIGLTNAEHRDNSTGFQYSQALYLNDAGQVAGHATRYSGSTYNGESAWFYNGTTTQKIGFTGGVHTSSSGFQSNQVTALNSAGQVIGTALQYSGSDANGLSAWRYSGGTTQQIGLLGAGHTNSSNGSQHNYARAINESGQVVGDAERFSGATFAGSSAWIQSGSTVQEIGLVGGVHTRSDGYQYNASTHLSNTGYVVGIADRYNGTDDNGRSTWIYNGTSTQEIGLAGGVHTRSDGYQQNYLEALNDAGQVAGGAERFNGLDHHGYSTWFYDGTSTQEIGLSGGEYTRSDGYQSNSISYTAISSLNASGLVAGLAERFDGMNTVSSSAWVYDSATGQTYSMDAPLSFAPSDVAYSDSNIYYVGDDGLVLGAYSFTDTGNVITGGAFSFTVAEGWNDLGNLVEGGMDEAGWLVLSAAYRANNSGQIIGDGLRITAEGSESGAFLLTPVPVPEPTTWAMLVVGLGLVAGAARRRRVERIVV